MEKRKELIIWRSLPIEENKSALESFSIAIIWVSAVEIYLSEYLEHCEIKINKNSTLGSLIGKFEAYTKTENPNLGNLNKKSIKTIICELNKLKDLRNKYIHEAVLKQQESNINRRYLKMKILGMKYFNTFFYLRNEPEEVNDQFLDLLGQYIGEL